MTKTGAENLAKNLRATLYRALNESRLGHALLFIHETGQSFSSELDLFMKDLCCMRASSEGACGSCASCNVFEKEISERAHPDCLWLYPPEDSAAYTVDSLKVLFQKMALSKGMSPRRVILISQAELLSGTGASAGNALLKVLEEPRADTYLILTSSRPHAVLGTLRSRCQIFKGFSREKAAMGDEAQERLTHWSALGAWLSGGAKPIKNVETPADKDSFWQDKDKSISELEFLYAHWWHELKNKWESFERSECQRLCGFFAKLEELMSDLKRHGQPPLQWLSFKVQTGIMV